MRPVRTARTQHVATSPDPDVEGLPLYLEDDAICSVWTLTDEERRFIVDGGNIRLAVWSPPGHPLAPVALAVVGDQEVPDGDAG